MAKLPFMKFYPSDWLQDCQVLSLQARGAWQTIICKAWHESHRGSVTLKLDAWARLFSCTSDIADRVIAELAETQTADIVQDGDNVTISCRRIERDWEKQEEFHKERSESGKRGLAKRWSCKKSSNSLAIMEQQKELSESSTESGKKGGKKSKKNSMHMQDVDDDADTNKISYSSANSSAIACQKSEVRSQKDIPPIVPQGTDKSELQLKVERLLKRRVSTPWSEKELKVYRQNQLVIEATTSEDWEKLQAYYRQSPYARKDLATLLNNWNGEIDRAIRFKVEPEKPDEKRISAAEYVD